jgi:hypothetical protein
MFIAIILVGLGFLPSGQPTDYDTHHSIQLGEYSTLIECKTAIDEFLRNNYQSKGSKGRYMLQMLDGFCLKN